MKLSQIINQKKPKLSFEVFPPKSWDKLESVIATTEKIAELSPSYMSVTYGAGGGTSDYTVKIASNLKNNCGVESLAHLTCVTSSKERVREQLDLLKENNIENILALRGDIPAGFDTSALEYHYASELIYDIKEYMGDSFCIGGACYPEGHPDSPNYKKDIEHLREKVLAGAEFLTTQMFFDNDIFYNFMYRIREAGIEVPIIPGIMPVTNPGTIKRTIAISGNALPQKIIRMVDRYGDNPESLKQAGIAYATEQIIDLYANGIDNIHVYCMNKPDVAEKIKANISEILK